MRPALSLALALALGIGLSQWARPHPYLAAALALVALLGALVVARCRPADRGARWAYGLVLLAAVAFGALRYAQVRIQYPQVWQAWLGQQVQVTGTTVEARPSRQGWQAVLAVKAATALDRPPPAAIWPAGGRVLVFGGGEMPRVGQRLRLAGQVVEISPATTPGAYDAHERWGNRGVFVQVRPTAGIERLETDPRHWLARAAGMARGRMEALFRDGLPPDQATLLSGLLLGDQGGLPDEWVADFRATGTLHILAASGANVALVVLPLLWLLARLGVSRRLAATLALPAVWFYCFMAGADASILRAAVMATLMLLGVALERRSDGLSALAGAAVLMLVLYPGMLFDLGFQLSFAATAGILLLAKPFTDWLNRWLLRPVAMALAVTLAAQLAAEPITMVYFGTLSPVAPVANLLVEVLVAPLVWAALGIGAVGQIWPAVAAAALGLVVWPLRLLTWMVSLVAALPLAQVAFTPPPAWVGLAWYGVLGLGMWSISRTGPTGHLPGSIRRLVRRCGERWRRWTLGGVAAVGLVGALGAAAAFGQPAPARQAELVVLPTAGQAVVLRLPEGTALIGAGQADPPESNRRPRIDDGADVVVPYLQGIGVRRLEALLLLSFRSNHAGAAVSVLDRLPVGRLAVTPKDVTGGVPHQPPPGLMAAVLDEARLLALPLTALVPGTQWQGPSGWRVSVPAAGLLRVQQGRAAVLVVGALDSGDPGALAAAGDLRADVVVLPERGLPKGAVPELLALARPETVVQMPASGAGRADGRPVADWAGPGAHVLEPSRQGRIRIGLGGDRARIMTQRPAPTMGDQRRWLRAW